MLKKYITFVLLITLVLFSSDILAQGGSGGPPCGSPPCGPPPPPDTPIDGGIGILLALGIGYAVKKIRDK
jgi:hypothetical protein